MQVIGKRGNRLGGIVKKGEKKGHPQRGKRKREKSPMKKARKNQIKRFSREGGDNESCPVPK